MAQKALQGTLLPQREEKHRISAEDIKNAVATEWHVDGKALASHRRTKDLTGPRQVAMYLIRELLGLPLVQIGAVFGGRDHSTVIHSIRKVEGALESDPALRRSIQRIRDALARPV